MAPTKYGSSRFRQLPLRYISSTKIRAGTVMGTVAGRRRRRSGATVSKPDENEARSSYLALRRLRPPDLESHDENEVSYDFPSAAMNTWGRGRSCDKKSRRRYPHRPSRLRLHIFSVADREGQPTHRRRSRGNEP